MLSEAQAWEVLRQVPDPEIPVISVTELGIVREVRSAPDTLTVVMTPTYCGCPATQAIERSILEALAQAGAQTVQVEVRLAPAWTTDWIAPDAAERLRAYGIVPPASSIPGEPQPLRFVPRLACPRCGSTHTQRLSEFGSTACKALYRCQDCREPFEYFKPL
jgi:ring-1,2-phenylacetyl-CoA epoxidase subunit PaaD